MPPTKPTHNQSNYRIQPNPFRTVDTYKYSTMQKPSKQQKVLIARVSVWSILYRLLLHFLFLSLHFFVLAFFPFACLFSIFDSHNFFCVFARCAHLFVVVVIIAFSLRSLCTLDAQQEMFCHSWVKHESCEFFIICDVLWTPPPPPLLRRHSRVFSPLIWWY